ncbi:PAS domain S-box protein [Ramlibacter sp. AN1015]|uniref:PAS domain S-box protein n=1 Tax=Ramlibacter sp. AN1015 TaxID=3133428 RepID=UPI0030C0208B
MPTALPPEPFQPLPRDANWRRNLWLFPGVLACVFAGLVAAWASNIDGSEREAFRRLLQADASSVEAQLLARLEAERSVLREIGAQLSDATTPGDTALQAVPAIRAGLDRLWNRVVWLDADHQVAGRAERASPRQPAGAGELQIRTRGLAQHLQAPVHGGGQLLARYEITDLLDSTDLVWLNQRYEVSFVSDLGEVIATTASFGRPAQGQMHEHVLAASPELRVVLRPFVEPPAWWRIPQTVALLAGLLLLGAAGSLLLRRQMARVAGAMAAARREAAWRQAMEDSALVGLRARDLQGRILFVNRTLCEMVGWSAKELVGLAPPLPFWPPDAVDTMLARNLDTLAGGAPRTGYETHWLHRDGHGIDVMIFESPLLDPQGRHVGWMGSIVDISVRKQLEERERRHTEVMAQHARLHDLGLVASELAHELNQPLSAVIGYGAGLAKAMRSQPACDPQLLDAAEQVHQHARKAGDIVHWIRRQAQRGGAQCLPEDIGALVTGVCELRARAFERLGIRLTCTLQGAPLPPVTLDRVGIEQVLSNLMRNAGDALAGRSGARSIAVQAACVAGGVAIEVSDTGPGLGGSSLETLCAPFHTSKRDGNALGLGLGIARTIVEAHGGSLEAGDRTEGGAWFRFTLPLLPPHLTTAATAEDVGVDAATLP